MRLDAHLKEDAVYRVDLGQLIDGAKVLREFNLANGVLESAAVELSDSSSNMPELEDGCASDDGAEDAMPLAEVSVPASVRTACERSLARCMSTHFSLLCAVQLMAEANAKARAEAEAKAKPKAKSKPFETFAGRRYVPFNTVAAVRIFHIDDKSAAEIPARALRAGIEIRPNRSRLSHCAR